MVGHFPIYAAAIDYPVDANSLDNLIYWAAHQAHQVHREFLNPVAKKLAYLHVEAPQGLT